MTFTPSSPSGERHFVRFTEKNEHEGETWHLWLQMTGNEAELAKFRALLDAAQVGSKHILADHVEPEWAVDILVEYADGETTWAPTHQKITGKFTCPDDLGENAERLYKCGARKFFTDYYVTFATDVSSATDRCDHRGDPVTTTHDDVIRETALKIIRLATADIESVEVLARDDEVMGLGIKLAERVLAAGAGPSVAGVTSPIARSAPAPRLDERTWRDIITVLRYVSAGIGYTRTAATLYPDARARRALGALRDLRWDVPEELSPSDKKE